MKKSVVTNRMVRGRVIPAENNKNKALKQGSNKQHAASEKKHAAASDIVTLTQSEFDTILHAIGKLSMEKGEHFVILLCRNYMLISNFELLYKARGSTFHTRNKK